MGLQQMSKNDIDLRHYLTKREERFFDSKQSFIIGLLEIDNFNNCIDKLLVSTKDYYVGYFPNFELQFSCVHPFSNKTADQRNFAVMLFIEGTNINLNSKNRLTSSLIGKSYFQETMSFRLIHEIPRFFNEFGIELGSRDFELREDTLGFFEYFVKKDSKEYEFFTEIANFYGHKKTKGHV
jgi:hypothetical protein